MFSVMLNPVLMSVFLYFRTLLAHEKLKAAVFPVFDLKWDIIAHSTLSTEVKQVATNGVNRNGIQLSFDTTFLPVSLMLEWVIQSLKRTFAPGDPLVAGFEPRSRRHFT